MSPVPTPSQSDAMTVLGNFIVSIFPAGTVIVQGYDNLVPEPTAANSVIMLPIMRQRIETNTDTYLDNAYIASVSGTVMTVTAMDFGTIAVGQKLFGVGVVIGTTIAAFGSGTGGVGTYTLSQGNGTIASGTLASGTESILQPISLTVQCDVHGPASADNAQTLSTLFRDPYGVDFFSAINPDIAPLYADDPRLIPFLNDSQQIETRWVVSCVLQVNQSVSVPQDFADQVTITLIPAESYPV